MTYVFHQQTDWNNCMETGKDNIALELITSSEYVSLFLKITFIMLK